MLALFLASSSTIGTALDIRSTSFLISPADSSITCCPCLAEELASLAAPTATSAFWTTRLAVCVISSAAVATKSTSLNCDSLLWRVLEAEAFAALVVFATCSDVAITSLIVGCSLSRNRLKPCANCPTSSCDLTSSLWVKSPSPDAISSNLSTT